MLAKRIIPCLDVDRGRVVKGINGVITGRAIYQGTLDFKKAQAEADKLAKGKGLKTQD